MKNNKFLKEEYKPKYFLYTNNCYFTIIKSDGTEIPINPKQEHVTNN